MCNEVNTISDNFYYQFGLSFMNCANCEKGSDKYTAKIENWAKDLLKKVEELTAENKILKNNIFIPGKGITYAERAHLLDKKNDKLKHVIAGLNENKKELQIKIQYAKAENKDYIQYLEKQSTALSDENSKLKKEIKAWKIASFAYEFMGDRLEYLHIENKKLKETIDSLTQAKERGQNELNDLISQSFTCAGLMKFLNIDENTVKRLIKDNDIICFSATNWYFPIWQFAKRPGIISGPPTLIKGILHINKILIQKSDRFSIIRFFLNPNSRLSGDTPLNQLIAGNLPDVILAAEAYGEHGCA